MAAGTVVTKSILPNKIWDEVSAKKMGNILNMRIVFICGSLEPGRDGVGDYTRRLAVELIKQGHQVTAIALNDQNVNEVTTASQSQDFTDVKVLRLPATLKRKSRFEYAKKWIDDMNPDLLSLQFVPFAFHSKGLSFQLHRRLKNLGSGRKWHIMFHELWVGMEQNSDFKFVVWGKLQRLLIRLLISFIKPISVHTQAKFYQMQLAGLGVKAAYLPLFSNIPVFNNHRYESRSIKVDLNKKPREISLTLFGGIHSGAPVRQFVEEVAIYAKSNNVIITLQIMGRSGVEQEHWASVWRQSTGLSVELLGEQSEKCISEILSRSTLGISTTPFALIDKSSAVAVMREHYLPVLCVSKPWYPHKRINYEIPDGITDYKTGNFSFFMKEKLSPSCAPVSVISRQFVNSVC